MSETNVEWSAIDFLRQTVGRENGFTTTFIDAIEEVTVQAERAHELDVENSRLKDDWKGTQEVLRKSIEISNDYESENVRLREALEFYADKKNYNEIDIEESIIAKDLGKRAREKLGEKHAHCT